MQILKRTKGIDFTAKKSGLLGQAEISLIDVKSGKVTDKIKQKNSFTSALDSLYNGSAFNMANRLLSLPDNINGSNLNPIPLQNPPYRTALGGIILFPSTSALTELYPDFTNNYPTGYASVAEYTQDDPKQGAFDSVNSGEVTNGYKYVYNWGSAFGNGRIETVSLSHVNCYKYFNDHALSILSSVGYARTLNTGWDRRPIGINSKGLYCNNGENGGGNIYLVRYPERMIDFLFNYSDMVANYKATEEAIPDFTYSGNDTMFAVNEDYIHVFKVTSSSASSSSITYTKIDCSDWSKTVTTLTVGTAVVGSQSLDNGTTVAVRGNYAYLPKSGYGSVIKINLTNTADFDELEMPTGASLNRGTTLCGNIIYGYNFVIGDDDIVRLSANYSNYRPCYMDGVWIGKIYIGNSSNHSLITDVLTPYCATKAVLDNPVTKDNTKQMIVNYTVTQV